MSEKNTGGGAFSTKYPYTGGMTLRDYFAAKAMEGDMANSSGNSVIDLNDTLFAAASMYYRIADEMLKAREAVEL